MKTPFLLLALLPLAAWAQAPALTTLAPARNAGSAPRTGPVSLTFSQPVTGAAALRVHGSMWRGERAGTATGDGSSVLSFQPRQVFAPGEEVSVTVPASVRSTGGQALASGQVAQFRVAAGPATGTFGPEQSAGNMFGSSTGLYDPLLVDVNNDGRLDILHTDVLNGNAVRIYLSNGPGTFGNATTTHTGSEPFSLTAADFNHDGNLDLMTSGWNGFVRHYVTAIALGNGQGQFTPRATLPTVDGMALSPRVGDLNADGHLDVAFLEHAPSATAPGTTIHTSLLVRLGDGQGNFTSEPNMVLPWAGGGGVAGFKLADLNNDGRLDVLYSNINGELEAYLGNGRGGFAPTPVSTAGLYDRLLVDFTGDGTLDVLTIVPNGDVRIHAGNGQGAFAATGSLALILPTPSSSITPGDIDGDGDLDLLTSARINNPNGGFSREARTWINGGNGTFTLGTIIPGSYGAFSTGDINNDGTLDFTLLDGYYGYTSIRLNAPLATAPTLTAFTPNTGGTGTTVTLTGTNFTGATTVLIGGVAVTGFTVVNATTITFPVPAGSPSGLITVVTPTGQATSAAPFLLPTATRPAAHALPVELFPNPARGTVQLQLPTAGPLTVAFYNGLGQCVRQSSTLLASGRAALDLTGLAPGLYTLQLQAGQRSATRQLVVE